MTLLPKAQPHEVGDSAGPGGKRLGLLDWGRYAEYFSRPGLGKLLWEFFFFAFPFSLFIGGFALFAAQRYEWNGHPVGAKEVGYFFAYVGFLGIILQGGLMGRLVKKFGERALVRSGFLRDSWLCLVGPYPDRRTIRRRIHCQFIRHERAPSVNYRALDHS